MNNKLVIGSVAVALILGAYGAFRSAPAQVVERVIEKNLGALAGPDIPSPYLRWGDKVTYRAAVDATSGTSTPIRIQGPAATSTVTVTFSITTPTTTALTWAVSTSTSRQGYATTTPFYTRGVAASAQDQFVVVPTLSQTNVVPPNGWVTISAYGLGSGGAANGGVIFGGRATMEFQVF
jgi:hypothetical protein